MRVPASFTLRGGRLHPAALRVQPFLAVTVTVAAQDGGSHAVEIDADRTYRATIPAGGRASIRLPGQPPGRYEVRVDDARAALEVGGD